MCFFAVATIDHIILIAYLGAVIGIGVWLGRGQKNLSDYLLGGRDLPWWAVLGSIVATETSTVTFLSIPGWIASPAGDLTFLQLPLGYILGRFVVAVVLLPSYFRGEIFTAYEVLHRRFGGATKTVASILFLITRNLGDGLRLLLAAIVLEQLTGFSFFACIAIMGLGTIVYTVLGGMKSVVWNDCAQLLVYLLGAIAAGVVILQALPEGWEQVRDFAREQGKLRMFDFEFTLDASRPYTFWGGLIGGMFLTTATHGADQLMVQRYLCARSQRAAALAVVASGIVVFFQFVLFVGVGLALATFYHPRVFTKSDAIFADFIVSHMPPVLAGLTLAAVFAAAMSTLSSSLNSSAASAIKDLILPVYRKPLTDRATLWISRGLTVLFGIVQIIVGILGLNLTESVINHVLAIAGFTTGIVLGVFLLGLATRNVCQDAALSGLVCGLTAVSYAAFWFRIAWPWFTVVGVSSTFLCGWLAQVAIDTLGEPPPNDRKPIDPSARSGDAP